MQLIALMMRLSSMTVLAVAGLVLAVVPACDRGDLGRGAQTTTTSATTPRPDATATTTHTVDNAGFVDNGGRTSEQTSRTEFSGMRATETGSERPTGTPGEGIPLGRTPAVAPRQREAVSPALEAATSPSPRVAAEAPSVEAIGRIARARCDRDTSCNRVGAGKLFTTQHSCVESQRDVARADVMSLGCSKGVDSAALGACLNGLRGRTCNDKGLALDGVEECRGSAVCAK